MEKFNKLSRTEMKTILGGNMPIGAGGEDGGTCSVSVTCNLSTTISCSGAGGACHYQDQNNNSSPVVYGYVQCDSDPKIECK